MKYSNSSILLPKKNLYFLDGRSTFFFFILHLVLTNFKKKNESICRRGKLICFSPQEIDFCSIYHQIFSNQQLEIKQESVSYKIFFVASRRIPHENQQPFHFYTFNSQCVCMMSDLCMLINVFTKKNLFVDVGKEGAVGG